MSKLKLAIYWGAACGGCDVAVLDVHEYILNVAELADIVLWPIATDFKYHHVEEMEDGAIDVTLFQGAVRNSENEHLARLLRQKSKILVAFGSCAMGGGIPALGNMANRELIFERVYGTSPSTANENGAVPQPHLQVAEGELEVPTFFNTVKTLRQTVDVDYFMPGCPPAPHQIIGVLGVIASGQLPPKGAVVGASDKSLCEECPREKEDKKIPRIQNIALAAPEPDECFLEQGFICLGSATRGGCGSRCVRSGMPCRGCYGPLPNASEQGAKLIGAIGSVLDSNDPEQIANLVSQIQDPMGTFYRFGFADSFFRGTVQ